MNDEQQLIYEYLNENANGFANRKTSNQIRAACGLDSGGPTNEHVRDLIRDMIFSHSCCIGSVMYNRGYWIIQNQEELDKVITSLRNRADGVIKRGEALILNWDLRNG